jgi:hypothetical protein
MQAEMGGGKCGQGAASASFALVVGGAIKTDNVVLGTIGHAIAGGIGAELAGGKFGNGALTGAFGYLYNCLQHTCPGNYDKNDPSYHEYGPWDTGRLCKASEASCLPSLSYAIHRYNGPLQERGIGVGETAVVSLAGNNPITVQSMGPHLVSNVTHGDHILRRGVVLRWVGVDTEGYGRIYTYGEGVNISSTMSWLNTNFFAPIAFRFDVPLTNRIDAWKFRNCSWCPR